MKRIALALFLILTFQILAFGQDGNPATCSCECCTFQRNPNKKVGWLCSCPYAEKWRKSQEEKSQREQAEKKSPNTSVTGTIPLGQPCPPYPLIDGVYIRCCHGHLFGHCPTCGNPKTTPSSASANPEGLNFPGTPEQQLAAQKRQQEEWQRQKKIQDVNALTGAFQDALSSINKGNEERFAKQLEGTQDKVADINNQSNLYQPKDDKGIMGDAKRHNQSTDNLVPGQDEDEAESLKTSSSPTGRQLPDFRTLLNSIVNPDGFSTEVAELSLKSLRKNDPSLDDALSIIELGQKVEKWGKYVDKALDVASGKTSLKEITEEYVKPSTIEKLFPYSSNAAIKEVQKNNNTFIGKVADGVTASLNYIAADATPQELQQGLEAATRPFTYSDIIPSFLTSNKQITAADFAKIGIAGAVMAATGVPIWIGIAAVGKYAFSPSRK